MYKVEIPADRLQEAAIQRRRRLDEERKKIIFNPRVRIMGVRQFSFRIGINLIVLQVDLKSLDEQITTKKEIQSLEKARDSAFGRTSCPPFYDDN